MQKRQIGARSASDLAFSTNVPDRVRPRSLSLVYNPKTAVPNGHFSIVWRAETFLVDYDSPYVKTVDSLLVKHTGDLMFYPDSVSGLSGGEECTKVGCIECTKISTTQICNERLDRFACLDAKSNELSSVGQLLQALKGAKVVQTTNFGPGSLFNTATTERKELINEVGHGFEITSGDVLYIERVDVDEAYRGLGLGLFLIDMADRVINSYMSLCLMIPYPLQWLRRERRAWEQYSTSPVSAELEEARIQDVAQFEAAQAKIAAHYKLLGFRRLKHGETEFMGRWNGEMLPRIQAVCPHLFR